MRREIWEKNVAKIDAHNKLFEQGKTTFTMGENHLADRVSYSYLKKNELINSRLIKINSLIFALTDWRGIGQTDWTETDPPPLRKLKSNKINYILFR